MGESQAFPWEGKVPSEARRMRSRLQVIHLPRFIPPASTSSGLRATFPSQGKAWGFRFQGIRSTIDSHWECEFIFPPFSLDKSVSTVYNAYIQFEVILCIS